MQIETLICPGLLGHKRHSRPLIPTEQCNSVTRLVPKKCRCCDRALSGTDPALWQYQVTELPPIKRKTSQYLPDLL